jgi:hypothetical protein
MQQVIGLQTTSCCSEMMHEILVEIEIAMRGAILTEPRAKDCQVDAIWRARKARSRQILATPQAKRH